MPAKITFSGIDEATDLDAVFHLACQGVEFAILLSASPEGRNRYPGEEWIQAAAGRLGRKCAVHICGRAARGALLDGSYDHLLKQVGRIQVNGVVSVDELGEILRRFDTQDIITQHTAANAHLVLAHKQLGSLGHHHAVLVDDSGGRGVTPSSWTRPETSCPVGFAGGLGPDNIATEFPRILLAAEGPWWVDMESKLRDEQDWFSLARCADVLAQVRPHMG